MSTPLLPCVEIEPNLPANASVIWLHGLGANGHDFEPIVPELNLPANLHIRFVFPHAPSIPVTINGGMVMPAWYDILEMSIDRKIDTAQIEKSSQAIKALIAREEERGISTERIVIAGFSQGGAVAYETALSYHKPLAGLIALSTYLATQDTLQRHEANKDIPTLIGHGVQDPVVPEILGQKALAKMTEWGYTPEYKTYPMAHAVCVQEIQDISVVLSLMLSNDLSSKSLD